MPIATKEIPQFTAKKLFLSDTELESKINDFLNSGYWIESILSNEDNVLIVFAKLRNEDSEMETIN